jgi:hypothetical protein
MTYLKNLLYTQFLMLINKIIFLELLEKDQENAKHVFSKEAILYMMRLSRYFAFFLVNKSIKKILKYIFSYSFTSSIQPCKNNQEKKFAQILHFQHLTIFFTRLLTFIKE